MAADEHPSLTRFFLGFAAFVVIVAGMKAAESLLVPFLLSIFIAVICGPPLAWMTKRGVPLILAMLVVVAFIVVFGVAVGAIVSTSINDFSQDLPVYQEKLSTITATFLAWLGGMGFDLPINQIQENIKPGTVMGMVGKALASLGNVMTNAFLILLTVIFILSESAMFHSKLERAAGEGSKSLQAIERFTSSINQYMAIKTGLSLLTGVLIMCWLWIIGVDYPVLWGLVAFLLNFVPNLGSIIAAVPAVLLALIQLGTGDALLTAVGYVFANVLVGNVLEPRMMGKGLDLSTLVVFLSLVFWGWVLGPVGMLLSVPLTMTVKIALESTGKPSIVSVLLGAGVPENQLSAQPLEWKKGE